MYHMHSWSIVIQTDALFPLYICSVSVPFLVRDRRSVPVQSQQGDDLNRHIRWDQNFTNQRIFIEFARTINQI
jgi:hypothetical protein